MLPRPHLATKAASRGSTLAHDPGRQHQASQLGGGPKSLRACTQGSEPMLQNDDDGRVDEREWGEEVDVDHRDAVDQTMSRQRIAPE